MNSHYLRVEDQWTLGYVRQYFSYKDLHSEQGEAFAESNPTNLFRICGVALYHNVHFIPLPPKKGTYSSVHLVFVVVSFDDQNQFETYPVRSFHPNLPEERRFFTIRENGISPDALHLYRPPVTSKLNSDFFMEGVTNEMPICNLSARQMGVILTFQPASSSYIYDSVILANVRKSFLFIIKKLNSTISMEEKNAFSNVLQANIYLHRQSGSNLTLKKRRQRSSHFTELIVNNRHKEIVVGDFFKKTLVIQQKLKRNFSFEDRKVSKANKCINNMDFKKAMETLLREDIPIKAENFQQEIRASFPPKNDSLLTEQERHDLMQKCDPATVPLIAKPEAVKTQINKLFRNRQPGLDGVTVEHFLSIFNGGKGHKQLKEQLLKEYSLFLQKFFTGELSEHQLQLFHQVKLAGIPKNEEQCRVIMLFSFHSKLAFSLFSSSKIKRKIVQEDLPYQFGSKQAGAEAVVHMVQLALLLNPHNDVFSADAMKAYYYLNRDIFLKEFKEKCPQLYNLLLGKYKGSTDAFFYDICKGVCFVSQVEGGSPGAPEMGLGYELGVSGLSAELAQLLELQAGDEITWVHLFKSW